MRKAYCDRCHKECYVTNLIELPKKNGHINSEFVDLCDICTGILYLKVRDFIHEGETPSGLVRFLGRLFLGHKEKDSVSVSLTDDGVTDKFRE